MLIAMKGERSKDKHSEETAFVLRMPFLVPVTFSNDTLCFILESRYSSTVITVTLSDALCIHTNTHFPTTLCYAAR